MRYNLILAKHGLRFSSSNTSDFSYWMTDYCFPFCGFDFAGVGKIDFVVQTISRQVIHISVFL